MSYVFKLLSCFVLFFFIMIQISVGKELESDYPLLLGDDHGIGLKN